MDLESHFESLPGENHDGRYKQRLQQLFFPEGIAFNGNRFNRTARTAALFS